MNKFEKLFYFSHSLYDSKQSVVIFALHMEKTILLSTYKNKKRVISRQLSFVPFVI